MASIGENIKRLRTENGWSQEELAQKIGKTRAAISQYESNKTVPRMGSIEKMCEVFGVKKREIVEKHVNYAIVSINDNLTEDEQELVRLYRKLSAKGKHAVLTGLRDFASGQ